MTSRTLPDFENPPLVEVALSVQFEPLEKFGSPQIGLLWTEFRGSFPNTEEHPPLEPVIEQFGVTPGLGVAQVRLRMLESPPTPRVWFVNPTGTELIQVQKDRFCHNWRKVGDGDTYPRYEPIRETFHSELKTFKAFLAREELGQLMFNQCEVSYVNHIVAGTGWQNHGELANVLNVFRTINDDANVREPEDVRMEIRYVLKDDRDERIGRLHVSVQPVFRRSDEHPMLLLALTARSRPGGNEMEDAIRCLDAGRDRIVRSFASITTPQMHKVWRRKDVLCP
jgi:uncharacterized protein (TIGR04255 family)